MRNLSVATICFFILGFVAIGVGIGAWASPALKEIPPHGFSFEKEVVVPLDPNAAFDAFTGDITPWWDHHFSAKPARLVIEPKPGGSFAEIFDEQGNGVIHARVTWSERGKKLVFRGALGPFHSLAADWVHTFTFEKTEGGTRIKASIHAMGEVEPAFEMGVSKVWDHFLVEQFKTYAEKLAKAKGN